MLSSFSSKPGTVSLEAAVFSAFDSWVLLVLQEVNTELNPAVAKVPVAIKSRRFIVLVV